VFKRPYHTSESISKKNLRSITTMWALLEILTKAKRLVYSFSSTNSSLSTPAMFGLTKLVDQDNQVLARDSLEDQQLHDKSLVINTHLDRESFESQKASVEIILETVNNVIAEDNKYRKKQIENIYVMGDFNIADNNSIFDILYDSKYKFVSARQVADTYDAGVNTFHDFQGENYELTSIIDHILFSSTKIVSKFEVLKSEPPYVSDHYPVVANFFNP
jgi:exonuclease III